AATVWTGYVSSFEEMIAARVVMGISAAFYIPTGLALITDYHRGKTRSLATGLHFSGLYTGLALGGVGGYIAELWGWRYGFHLFGVVGCIYAVLLLFFLRDNSVKSTVTVDTHTAKSPVKLGESIRSLLNERSYLVLLTYFVVLGVANWLIYAWLPTFLKDRF